MCISYGRIKDGPGKFRCTGPQSLQSTMKLNSWSGTALVEEVMWLDQVKVDSEDDALLYQIGYGMSNCLTLYNSMIQCLTLHGAAIG